MCVCVCVCVHYSAISTTTTRYRTVKITHNVIVSSYSSVWEIYLNICALFKFLYFVPACQSLSGTKFDFFSFIARFLRQILQSVPPILEMFLILFFILLIFATLGFYLFSPNQKDPYFSSFSQGFVSLYVLLTTAK